MNGHTKCIEMILDRSIDINSKDTDGATALHWAASRGRENTVLILLERGADINTEDNYGKPFLTLFLKVTILLTNII